MAMVVRAFPLVVPTEDLEALAETLRTERSEEADAFFRQYGVHHESWHVQDTPHGKWVIGITVLEDPEEAAPRYAQCNDAFECWFKGEVNRLSGVQLNDQPLGPPTTTVYEWSQEDRPAVFRPL
jgi:hypothetical protein